MPEWLKGTYCKFVGLYLRWFKSSSAQIKKKCCKSFTCFLETRFLLHYPHLPLPPSVPPLPPVPPKGVQVVMGVRKWYVACCPLCTAAQPEGGNERNVVVVMALKGRRIMRFKEKHCLVIF